MKPVGEDLWWDYLCPAVANISPFKEAQSKMIALGVDAGEAGRILSSLHIEYTTSLFVAANKYRRENGQ